MKQQDGARKSSRRVGQAVPEWAFVPLDARQEKLLEDHFQRVVSMLDGDNAGISAATIIAARLTRRLFVKVVDVPARRQPDQMSTEEIRVLLMQPIYP